MFAAIFMYQNHTSSTAQGGGGSFKKRKTIGEIGCCESQTSMSQSEKTFNEGHDGCEMSSLLCA